MIGGQAHRSPSTGMQIHVNSILLLAQPRLRLLHILGDRIVANEAMRFGLVVELSRSEEGLLECFLIDLEILTIRIRFVETESDWRRDRGWSSTIVSHREV